MAAGRLTTRCSARTRASQRRPRLILWLAATFLSYRASLAAPPAAVDAQARPFNKPEIELLHNRIRHFAVLVEDFAKTNGVYPTILRGTGLQPYRLLESALPEADIHRYPATDLDGRDLLYWSDGKGYAVIAVGSDGKPDMDYATILSVPGPNARAVCRGESSDPASDIVFWNGQLCTWHGNPKP